MFRKEVIDSQKNRLLGEITLAQPFSIHITIGVVFLFFGILVAFLTTSNYARKETVKGYLVPNTGVIKIYPNRVRVLDSLYVSEGAVVKKGDVIAKVVLKRPQLNGEDLSESVISILNKQKGLLERDLLETNYLIEKELEALEQKVKDLNLSISSAERKIQLLSKKKTIKTSEYERFERLSKNSFVSKIDLQRREQEILLVEEALENANSTKISLQTNLNETKHIIRKKPHEKKLKSTQILMKTAEIQRLIDEAENNYSFNILAVDSGIITAIASKEGELLTQTRPLLSVIPKDAELVAELFFPTRSSGFVKKNDQARLRFDACPYQRFGFVESTVTIVDKSLLFDGEVNSPFPLNEPVYRVQTKLKSQSINAYGENFPLKAGMLIEADIILDKRSLFQWLFEPIYSLKGRI
ncbi:HlyD family secretion protein [Vibrio sp. Sgm 5]|uniref:HlyD family secretion protein n=1 Tax=Vibrio sp. Sgm 5 TaxID=2994387 RepID=UPI0022499BCF|nr:HlyD family efflux transporter periplasmic adaptor subunit [Vibrio sp. Sgm 5]MCX2789139.1 HlyD family efflux transporter periplasmic adaptor subunit [Vibrio sp. Sgm 5]